MQTEHSEAACGRLADRVFGIDPQLVLRNDVDRDVLLSRPPPLCDRNYIRRFMDPAEAVILSMFNGERTVARVAELWGEATSRSADEALAEVLALAECYSGTDPSDDDILITSDAAKKRPFVQYDPLDFVIPLDRVNLTEKRLRIPYRIYYIPTLYCSQACIYCYAHTEPAPEPALIPLERLCEIFDELGSLGVDVIQMSGGEVFTRRDIFALLEAIVERGMVPDIPTKIGLSYKAACWLRVLGVPLIQVSLDSADPEILDRMVGIKSYHTRVFSGLDNLRRAGMEVRVNTVLTPLNYRGVGDLIDYLGRLGNVTRVSLSPYGRSLFCHSDDLFVNEEQIAIAQDAAKERAQAYPQMTVTIGGIAAPAPESADERTRRWSKRAYCSANRDGIVILPDGRVTVCEELYTHPDFVIGDLNRQSVMEVWRSPQARALIRPDQAAVPDGACRTCADFDECHAQQGRCWRDVLKSYGWDKPHFPDPRCPQAPPGARLS